MSDKLPAELASLVEAERNAPGAPPGARARVHDRLMVTIGGGGAAGGGDGGGGGVGPATGSTAAVGGGAALGKWIVVGLAALVAASATIYAVRREPARPIAIAIPIPTPSPAVSPAPQPPPQASPIAQPPPPAAPAAAPRRPAASTLAAERALLDRALAALRAGDPPSALRLVDEHSRRHPRGELVEEREVIAIRALVKSADAAAARARAARFRARFPDSIQLEVIDAALASLP